MAFMWPAVVLSTGAVGSIAWAVFAESRRGSLQTIASVVDVVASASQQGAARVFLWPFALLVRPLFAGTLSEFMFAVAGALTVYAVSVCWLFWADARSADAADATAQRQVNEPGRSRRAYVARPVAWRLSTSGREEGAFIWKGVLQTLRTVDRRVLLRVLLFGGWMLFASMFMTRARGLVMIVGVFATWGAVFTLFMGPQIFRMDLRQDLAHLELLKTWPLRGASIIRGEIVWPAIVVTVLTWALGVSAMALSMTSRVPTPNRAAVWLAFLILIPGIVLAQYTIHNAVAVIFPGWVPLGASRLRGVDAAGQRLIVLAGNWLGLVVALVPGIAVTVALSFWLRPVLGPFVLPLGAVVTTLAVIGEMWVVTGALGPIYDRLDLTSVERPD